MIARAGSRGLVGEFWPRFDAWVESGSSTVRDVSVYRVVWGLLALVTMPRFSQLNRYPDSLYSPPPGPFRLLDGFPPESVLIALELATALAIAFVLVGLCTRTASIMATLLLLTGYGFNYSLGKIDHTILLVVTPAIMMFSGWGRRYSVDALLARTPDPTDEHPQWPQRLLGLVIGVAFATAAVKKLLSGWLAPSSQAAEGQFLAKFLPSDRTSPLSSLAAKVHVPALWELLDWGTVFVEFSPLLAIVSWAMFRWSLSMLAIFHLSVLLLLGIKFSTDMVVYGAFVSWASVSTAAIGRARSARGVLADRSGPPRRATTPRWQLASLAVAAAGTLAVVAWLLARYTPEFGKTVQIVIIAAGALVALLFIVSSAARLPAVRRRGHSRVSG